MGLLEGVNVALGVTGSIAAVRVVELAHELRRQGATVRGVCTESATDIVSPWAVDFATDEPVITQLTGQVEHVALCGEDGWADVLLIAPATANTIGKVAAAIDDTTVTTCATVALGAGIPVVVAPAMHEPMYDHPGVLDAIDRLEGWRVTVMAPRFEEGKAKIPTDEAIVLATARAGTDQPLAGRSVVVTSGATKEPVDPVRVLTSRASGQTGRAVARACYALGASVTLVHDGPPVPYADVRGVETASEMRDAVEAACQDADALVSAAAIADYTVLDPAKAKIDSGQTDLTLELEPTPKLLDRVRDQYQDLTMVGFKVESGGDADALVDAARTLQNRVGLAFVVANDASVMGAERTRAWIVSDTDATRVEGSKSTLGERVARTLADHLDG